ncbi:MAG: phage head-tail adapter protein [Lachnospiraceae bacterium]|nr:phage head-tail adapter protein [Lachnospiraceae bacterium]
MNKEWTELNKIMQLQLKKKESFADGIETLFILRSKLIETLHELKAELSRDDFYAIPFINSNGYHSKTIAYSIWHIFRIEDIVAHSLIKGDEQVFFAENYQKHIGSPIITTGNELVREQISDFSSQLNLEELYKYITNVKNSTDTIIGNLEYADLKRKMTEKDKDYLKSLNVVSTDESAIWLIDYWCNKDVKGLIQMPFSRHWIMHIEASIRIRNKIVKDKSL